MKGMLIAFNSDDVNQELWRSQSKDVNVSDTKDSHELLARFNPPIIANGKSSCPPPGTPNHSSVMEAFVLRPAPRIILLPFSV